MEDSLFRLIELGGYAGIFVLMLAETIFPPIPSEVVMPLAGLVAANGRLDLGGVALAGTAGAMVGNVFWYWIARSIGLARFKLVLLRYGRWLALDCRDVVRIRWLFRRYGRLLVLIGRALPTIRTIISLPAGVARMELRGFLLFSTMGTAIWSTGLATAGFVLGSQFSDVERSSAPLRRLCCSRSSSPMSGGKCAGRLRQGHR